MGVVYSAFNALITTISTIAVLLIVAVIFTYVIGVAVLVFWSLRFGIFKNPLMWFNPIKLIEYSGVITTVTTDDGSYIINYQGFIPKCRFISNK